MFKVGDIIRTDTRHTIALVAWAKPSSVHPEECFGKVIPLYNRFPVGLYEVGLGFSDWELVSPANHLIILPEAIRALDECLDNRKIDNLTYVEVLDGLIQHAK